MLDRNLQLRSLELFGGVPEGLFADPESHTWPVGHAIVVQGEQARGLILLVSGATEVSIDGQYIADRSAISVLGEMALIEQKPHSANVVARSVATTLEYPIARATRLMEEPAFVRNLLRDVSAKLRQATTDRGPRYRMLDEFFASFRAHTTPEIADELAERGIDGSPRHIEATVLFADVRGFTDIAASLPPTQLADELGAFLSMAVDVVHDHGGVVDKFIGDAVMAWWTYTEDGGHAERALAAARELVHRAPTFRLRDRPIAVRVGIETGLVFVGTIGNGTKRQHTALGTVVNTAARLQGATRDLTVAIAVGRGTYERLSEATKAELSPCGEIDLKGLGSVATWAVTETKGAD